MIFCEHINYNRVAGYSLNVTIKMTSFNTTFIDFLSDDNVLSHVVAQSGL